MSKKYTPSSNIKWIDVLESSRQVSALNELEDVADAIQIEMYESGSNTKTSFVSLKDFTIKGLKNILESYNKYTSGSKVNFKTLKNKNDYVNMVGALLAGDQRTYTAAKQSFKKVFLNKDWEDLTLKEKKIASDIFNLAKKQKLLNKKFEEGVSDAVIKSIWDTVRVNSVLGNTATENDINEMFLAILDRNMKTLGRDTDYLNNFRATGDVFESEDYVEFHTDDLTKSLLDEYFGLE